MEPEGRNDRPRRAAASMPISSSDPQKQHRVKAKPATKKNTKRKSNKKSVGEGNWWNIKDVIDERLEKGVVHYLVEWDGTDPNTGQPYDPGWEPEDNLTVAAITAWKEKKKRKRKETNTSAQDTNASRPASYDSTQQQSAPDNEPTRLSSSTRNRREGQKESSEEALRNEGIAEKAKPIPKQQKLTNPYPRRAAEQTTQEGLGALSDREEEEGGRRVRGIVVELPQKSPSEWLEFQRLSSSQASQLSAQQGQQSQTGWSQTQSTHDATSPQNRDRRVIPDSQEYSGISTLETQTSVSQLDLLTNSRTLQEGATQTQLSEGRSTRTDIPSHQPDNQVTGLLNNQGQSIATEIGTTSDTSSSQQSLAYRFPNRNSSQSQNTAGSGGFPTFQSQVSIGSIPQATSQPSINNKAAGSSPERNFSSNLPIPTTEKSVSAADSASLHTNSQAAQIVPRLNSHTPYSQATFALHEEGIVIPYTGTEQQSQQTSNSRYPNQALGELDGNTRDSSSALGDSNSVSQAKTDLSQSRATLGRSQDFIPASVQTPIVPAQQNNQRELPESPVTSSNMQNPPPFPPGMKTADKLRLRREREMAAFMLNSSSDVSANLDTPGSAPGQSEPEVPIDANSHAETVPGLSVIVPQPDLPMMLLEVSPEVVQAEQPSVVSTQISHEPQQSNSLPLVVAPAAINFDTPHDEPPTTLDPSHLTLSIEERDLSPSIPTDDALAESAGPEDFVPPLDSPKESDDESPQQYSNGLLPDIPSGVNEHLVTLPFIATASGRDQYNEIIHENETAIRDYNACFRQLPYQKPIPSLTATVDKLFSRLFDFCDFPPFLETVVELGPEAITKHAVGSNSKFCFVDEFLLRLNNMRSAKKILILARPGQLLDLLSTVVQTRGYHLIRSGQESVNPAAALSLVVAIHSTDEAPSSLPKDADAIIAFDHTYRQDLLPSFYEANTPLVLLLTNTNSIQHINMRVSERMDPLERKNLLILILARSMRHIWEPKQMTMPPQIAATFAHYLEDPDDDAFYWEPEELPEDIFRVHENTSSMQPSQHSIELFSHTPAPGSRKRSHDVIEESASKRPKMSQAQLVNNSSHVSDSVKDLLGDGIMSIPDTATVNVSIKALEALSAKVSQLTAELEESRIREMEFRQLSDRSKKEVDGYAASINKIQTRFMEALKDRGIFEAECTEAKEQASTLTTSLESARKENETLKDTNTELRKKLSEATESLLHSSVPELSKMAQLSQDLEESRAAAQRLEKRLTLAQGDHEYTKTAYQQASQGAAQLRVENGELEAQLEVLGRRASDNVARVHELQNRQEVAELARLLGEQRALVRDREAELNRLRDEVRSLRNGRRETRQSSVPRSPRLNALGAVLSPRTHLPTTPSARGAGGSSSRATSPISASGVGTTGVQYQQQQQQQQPPPPMGIFDSQFLGRHSHLRD